MILFKDFFITDKILLFKNVTFWKFQFLKIQLLKISTFYPLKNAIFILIFPRIHKQCNSQSVLVC